VMNFGNRNDAMVTLPKRRVNPDARLVPKQQNICVPIG
jgi:hypothetical protein